MCHYMVGVTLHQPYTFILPSLLLDKFKYKAIFNQKYRKKKPLDVQFYFYFFPSIRVLKLFFKNRMFDGVLD